MPSVDELTGELNREKYHSRYKKLLRSTIYTLVIVAAISVLVATLLLPVLQIYGTSMNPNLQEGDIVVSVKSPQFKTGDIIAFYYNNRVLVKRIIGCPGDSVVITDSGDVYVNNTLLDEPYLTEKSYGTADIEYPYTVPQNSFFVLGDHRESSVDSRSSLVGCVEKEEIIGKIIFFCRGRHIQGAVFIKFHGKYTADIFRHRHRHNLQFILNRRWKRCITRI